MDRLGFFKQGLSSLMDAASSVVGLKKAADSFVEVVDEALSNIKADIGFHLPSIDSAIYDGGASVLDNIAAMGYSSVEVGAYNNGKIHYKPHAEFKDLARKAGLRVKSAHLNRLLTPSSQEDVPMQMTEADKQWWQEAMDIHKGLGCKYIVMAQLPEQCNAESVGQYATYFNLVGDMAIERGMKFCFHPTKAHLQHPEVSVKAATNGATEEVEGGMGESANADVNATKAENNGSTVAKSLFEMLAEATDKNKVWFELDTLEALEANIDACELIKQHDGRVLLLHLHDYSVTGDSGAIDFDEIIKQGTQRGVAEVFVEVRNFNLPPMNCVERSYYYVEGLPSIRH
ncbi:MAG: TIM barrel protein [Alistipes sp.]|nr:TIM barrel protein [Alistipes sp.]